MSEMVERVAEAMYWRRVNPYRGSVTLSVSVAPWAGLAEEHRHGIIIWHCKSFWRDAARAAIEAMRDVPDVCYNQYRCDKVWRELTSKEVWNLWIDATLADDKASKAA